jgi:hypothetical protein
MPAAGANQAQTRLAGVTVGLALALVCWLAASGNWGLAVVVVTVAIAAVGAARQWPCAPLGALALAAVIPSSLWYVLTGGTDGALLSRVHPATVYVVALVGLGWHPPGRWREVLSGRWARVALAFQLLFVLLALGMSVAERGVRGLPVLLDNYVGPFLLFWTMSAGFRRWPWSRARTANFIVLAGVLLALAALLEGVLASNPLYEPVYGDVPWFPVATGEYRSTVTFGAPLAAANGLLFALAIVPLIPSLRNRTVSAAVLVLGILATGSRTASAAAFLLYPIVLFAWGERHQVSIRVQRSRTVALGLGAAVVLVMAAATPFGRHVIRRTTESVESTGVRVIAADYFLENVSSYEATGVGLGGSTDVSTAVFGSYISFENPWIMLAIDLGIPLAVLFAITLILSLRAATAGAPIAWAILAGVIGLIIFDSGYNSFGVRGIAAYLLWASLAFLRDSSSSYRSATAS